MALGTLSIDGLISNLKTSDLIAKLMDIERRPVRILQQKQQDLLKQKTTWSDLNARMLGLLGMVNPLTVVPTFQAKSATSSNTGILTASASSSATAASYTMRVQQLALAHSVGTDSHLQSESSNAMRTMLINEGISNAVNLTNSEIITITVGIATKSITVDTTSDTLSDLLSDINTQAGDLVTATMINDSPTTQRLVLTSKTTGRAGEIYFKDSTNGLLQKLGLLELGTPQTGSTQIADGGYNNNFTGVDGTDPAGFTEVAGTWQLKNNAYEQSGSTNGAIGFSEATAAGVFSNFEASATVNIVEEPGGGGLGPDTYYDLAGLAFRRTGGTYYTAMINADEVPAGSANAWTLELRRIGSGSALLGTYQYQFQNDTNYKLTVRAEGSRLTVFLNDVQVISATDSASPFPSGTVAFRTSLTHALFDNLEIKKVSAKNVLQRPQDAVFTLNNVPIISSSNTNTTALNGVTLNLVSAAPTTDVNVTVASDTTSVKATVQSFVSQYNDLVNFFRDQLRFNEGQSKVGTLFGSGLLMNVQNQLQNLMLSNIDPLQKTEFVGMGDGNLGDALGDFTLDNEITDIGDVKKVLAGSSEYLVRREGGHFAGGGNQVEVKLNGQLQFFDNTGVAAAVSNGQALKVTYMPAEKTAGSGGDSFGEYNLAKTIGFNLSNIKRIIADVAGTTQNFTIMGPNIFPALDANFPAGTPTTLANGFYVEVKTDSGTDNGSLRFVEVAGGTATRINVDDGTAKALYRGSDDYGSLAQVGVSVNDITDPTLKIDSTVLDAALSTNLQGVSEMFDDYTGSVANALRDYLYTLTKSDGTVADIQTDIQDEVDSVQDRINSMEETIARRQATLQKQFAKMEATLGLLQAQGVWLSQQISKLPSGFTLPGMTSSGG